MERNPSGALPESLGEVNAGIAPEGELNILLTERIVLFVLLFLPLRFLRFLLISYFAVPQKLLNDLIKGVFMR